MVSFNRDVLFKLSMCWGMYFTYKLHCVKLDEIFLQFAFVLFSLSLSMGTIKYLLEKMSQCQEMYIFMVQQLTFPQFAAYSGWSTEDVNEVDSDSMSLPIRAITEKNALTFEQHAVTHFLMLPTLSTNTLLLFVNCTCSIYSYFSQDTDLMWMRMLSRETPLNKEAKHLHVLGTRFRPVKLLSPVN